MTKLIFKTDLDIKLGKKQMKKYIQTRKAIIGSLGYELLRYRVEPSSKRGHHFWWICKGKNLLPSQINFMQFLLGDDWGRCLINSRRIKRGVKEWNKIFDHVIWRRKHDCN